MDEKTRYCVECDKPLEEDEDEEREFPHAAYSGVWWNEGIHEECLKIAEKRAHDLAVSNCQNI
jgi:hypothetical protein